jgi:general stress protein 26
LGPSGDLARLQEASFEGASAATLAGYPENKRMTERQLIQFLSDIAYLTIATVRKDGRPHAAMSTFVIHEGNAWIPTESGTLRRRNLDHTPFAALVIAEGGDGDHRIVLSEGPANVAPSAAVASDVIEAWKTKYIKEEAPRWADSWIEVRLSKLFSYQERN